jgi:hypothetical protein
MARIEAPAGAKAAGNSYSPEPVVTAPVVDSTGLGQNPLIAEGKGKAVAARMIGVDPATLRRALNS